VGLIDCHEINSLMSKSCGGVGFRTLHAINLATLEKKDWTHLTNLNGLIIHLYKAKYFSQSIFWSLIPVIIQIMLGAVFSYLNFS
jgi:hypothetical protein